MASNCPSIAVSAKGRGEQKGRNPFEIVKANGPFAGIGHNGAPTIAMDKAPGMSAWASGS